LAHAGIKDLRDLADQKVNVDLLNSGTAITAIRLFGQLKLRVAATYDSPNWHSIGYAKERLLQSPSWQENQLRYSPI